MKHKEMDWKAWLAVIIIVIVIGGIASGMRASAEAATPSDLPVVDDEETYWLDEVDGIVILDDPAYFMDVEDEEAAVSEENEAPSEEAEISLADLLSSDAESAAEPDASTEEAAQPAEVSDDTAESAVNPSTEEATDTPETGEQTVSPAETPTTEVTEAPADTQQPTDEPVEDSTDEPASDPTVTPDAPTTPPDTSTETPDNTPTEQPTQTPEQPDETPVDLKTLFDVDIKVPSGWRNSYSATVRIKITPASDQMWHKVRYRIGDEDWETVPDKDFVLYDGYYYTDIEVSYNAKMSVRLFGDEENYFDTNKEIRIFDHNAPEVTAGFRDLVLHVEAVDDLSEVAGIQVNSLLFTTLVDGVLDVRMEDPLNTFKQLAIRAYDYAGNFSDPVTLDNPYYVEPTPEPTATPKPTTKPTTKPTKKPSSSSSSGSSGTKATATPVVTATPAPTAVATQQPQIVYVTPDPSLYTYTQPVTTAEPETVYVPLGPGQPYKSDGNMQTLDMLYSASTNKQFITVQTRAGETYYMVIDYDKPIDEENDIYETYFLNLVDDRDLMSVVSEEEVQPTPTPQIVYVTPEPTQIPQQTTPIVVEDDGLEEMLPTILLIGGVAAVGGAIFWMMKKKKDAAAKNVPDFDDDEYEFEDDEETDGM